MIPSICLSCYNLVKSTRGSVIYYCLTDPEIVLGYYKEGSKYIPVPLLDCPVLKQSPKNSISDKELENQIQEYINEKCEHDVFVEKMFFFKLAIFVERTISISFLLADSNRLEEAEYLSILITEIEDIINSGEWPRINFIELKNTSDKIEDKIQEMVEEGIIEKNDYWNEDEDEDENIDLDL